MIRFKLIENHVHEALAAVKINKKLTAKNLYDLSHIKYIVQGMVVGTFVGFLVSLFRMGLDYSLEGLFVIYPYLKANPKLIVLYVLATIVLGLIVANIIRPIYAKGKMSWWSALWRNAIGALLSIGPGIFAGREGPSIKIGLYTAEGFAKRIFKDSSDMRFLLIHSGMAAGLGAAFSAPISGTLFLIEAVAIPFSGMLLATSMSASVASVCVTYLFFGLTPCLHVPYESTLPFSSYWVILCLGLVVGVASRVFQSIINACRSVYEKLPIDKEYTLLIPLLLVIPIGLIDPEILGGSHHFIRQLITEPFVSEAVNNPHVSVLGIVAIMIVARFIFTGVSCGATAPTGIFMPILTLGTVVGAFFAICLINVGYIDPSCYINIVVCAMAAFFGASLRTPLTAIVLVMETVGSVEMIMPLVIATWAANIVHKFLNGKSLYSD